MTLAADTPSASADKSPSRAFYNTAWRWHFYAGLYVAPFLIMLAIIGLIMLWSSVLVGRDGEKLYSIVPASQTVAVSEQANAAVSAVPGGSLIQDIVPRTEDQPAVFRVNVEKQSTMVAVAPCRGPVLGTWERRDTLYDLANLIHGTLLIGTLGDRLIEIAAGFGVVLTVTGTYLWWPRDGRGPARSLRPQLSGRGRQVWKSLHQTVGVYVAILLLFFLISGLSWTGIWGEKMTQAWSTFPAEKWVTLNTIFCLSVIFPSVRGIVMWWKRRPSGASRLVVPVVPENMSIWKSGAIVMVAVSLLFPLTGIVLVTVLVLDLLVTRHVKPLKCALS